MLMLIEVLPEIPNYKLDPLYFPRHTPSLRLQHFKRSEKPRFKVIPEKPRAEVNVTYYLKSIAYNNCNKFPPVAEVDTRSFVHTLSQRNKLRSLKSRCLFLMCLPF